MNTALISKLEDTLYDRSLNGGEIISIADAAQYIREIEWELGITYTDAEILKAWREAAERFCDEMASNAMQTWNDEKEAVLAGKKAYPSFENEEAAMAAVDQWIAQRPSKRREAHISALSEPELKALEGGVTLTVIADSSYSFTFECKSVEDALIDYKRLKRSGLKSKTAYYRIAGHSQTYYI